MAGIGLGAAVTGHLADTYGRRHVFILVNVLAMLGQTVQSLSTSWQLFAAIRFFIGFFSGEFWVLCTIRVMLMSHVQYSHITQENTNIAAVRFVVFSPRWSNDIVKGKSFYPILIQIITYCWCSNMILILWTKYRSKCGAYRSPDVCFVRLILPTITRKL